jgi:DNA-binding transcriptional ArsR family regulator
MPDLVQLILEMCAQSSSAVSFERLGQMFSTDRVTLLRHLATLQGLGLLELLRYRNESAISPAARITPRGMRYYLDGKTRFRREEKEIDTWERWLRDLVPFGHRRTEGPT